MFNSGGAFEAGNRGLIGFLYFCLHRKGDARRNRLSENSWPILLKN